MKDKLTFKVPSPSGTSFSNDCQIAEQALNVALSGNGYEVNAGKASSDEDETLLTGAKIPIEFYEILACRSADSEIGIYVGLSKRADKDFTNVEVIPWSAQQNRMLLWFLIPLGIIWLALSLVGTNFVYKHLGPAPGDRLIVTNFLSVVAFFIAALAALVALLPLVLLMGWFIRSKAPIAIPPADLQHASDMIRTKLSESRSATR